MNKIEGIEFNASESLLSDVIGQDKLPETLLRPFQALIKRILEASEAKPFLIYLQSSDTIRGVRDYFAHALARVLNQQVPSAVIVDCDFTAPGMSGVVPQKDALGFLDYLLYGSSLGVVTQEALQGVRVIGAGSFPVSKKMPVSLDSFVDAARRLAAQSRIVIFCGPDKDDGENIHPICEAADLLMNLSYEKRFPVGRIDPFEEELAKKCGSPVISVRISSSGDVIETAPEPAPEVIEEPSPPIEEEVVPAEPSSEQIQMDEEKKAEWQEEEAPRKASFSGLPFERKQSGSIWAKIIPAIIAIALIAFLYWWFFITKPMQGTGEEAQLAAVDTAATSGTPPEEDRSSEQEMDYVEGAGDADPGGEGKDPAGSAQVREDGSPGDDRATDAAQPVVDGDDGSAAPGAGEGNERLRQAGESSASDASGGDVYIAEDFSEFTGKYLIHVSSFRTLNRAREDAAYLLQNNFSGCVIPVDLDTKGIWYRVYTGPFDTREEALQQKIMLDELSRVKFTRITRPPSF
jgi:hypothetical protein